MNFYPAMTGAVQATELRAFRGDPSGATLVDFSWLLHRSFYGHRNLSTLVNGVTVQTGDMYGVLSTIRALVKHWPFRPVVLCLDGHDASRKEQSPGYKANRSDTEKPEVYRKVPEILKAAACFEGVYFAHDPSFEADDLIGTLADVLARAGFPVGIYSSDHDLYQALSSKEPAAGGTVEMIQKHGKFTFTLDGESLSIETFNVFPSCIPFLRAFKGDTSDNLPGYPRFPTKLAASLSMAFETPDDMLKETPTAVAVVVGAKPGEAKWIERVFEAPELLRTNYSVMKLKRVPSPKVYRAAPSQDVLKKYAMNSILATLESWSASPLEKLDAVSPEVESDE